MEFTKLLKYASASLFLVLLVHGLILGFSIPATIISIALLSVCFLMEQKLVLHERDEYNTKIQQILTSHSEELYRVGCSNEEVIKQLHAEYTKNQLDMIAKLESTHSQINTLKTATGMTRRN